MSSEPTDEPKLWPIGLAYWPLQDGEIYVVEGKPAEHWVVEFLGGFAALQNGIEQILGIYFQRHSPAVAKTLKKKHLRRLSDEDRWDYVKALAQDGGYVGNLMPPASESYWRCKHVRDALAHPVTKLQLGRTETIPDYHYQLSKEARKPQIPDPLTPEVIRVLTAETRWLNAFLDHISCLAGNLYDLPWARLDSGSSSTTGRTEILEPPPLPIPGDWFSEGLYRFVPDSPDDVS